MTYPKFKKRNKNKKYLGFFLHRTHYNFFAKLNIYKYMLIPYFEIGRAHV